MVQPQAIATLEHFLTIFRQPTSLEESVLRTQAGAAHFNTVLPKYSCYFDLHQPLQLSVCSPESTFDKS